MTVFMYCVLKISKTHMDSIYCAVHCAGVYYPGLYPYYVLISLRSFSKKQKGGNAKTGKVRKEIKLYCYAGTVTKSEKL